MDHRGKLGIGYYEMWRFECGSIDVRPCSSLSSGEEASRNNISCLDDPSATSLHPLSHRKVLTTSAPYPTIDVPVPTIVTKVRKTINSPFRQPCAIPAPCMKHQDQFCILKQRQEFITTLKLVALFALWCKKNGLKDHLLKDKWILGSRTLNPYGKGVSVISVVFRVIWLRDCSWLAQRCVCPWACGRDCLI